MIVLLALALPLCSRRKIPATEIHGTLYVPCPLLIVAVFLIEVVNRFVQRFIDQAVVLLSGTPVCVTDSVFFVFAGVVIIQVMVFMDTFTDPLAAQPVHAQFIVAISGQRHRLPGSQHDGSTFLLCCTATMVLGGVVIVEYIFTLEGAGYPLEVARLRDFHWSLGLRVVHGDRHRGALSQTQKAATIRGGSLVVTLRSSVRRNHRWNVYNHSFSLHSYPTCLKTQLIMVDAAGPERIHLFGMCARTRRYRSLKERKLFPG